MRLAIILLALALSVIAKKNDNNGRGNAYGHDKKHEIPTAETPEPGTWILMLTGGAVIAGARKFRKK